MSQGSTIEWTETTWNPVVGCTKVSSGCKNCYAERMAKRLAAMAEADISKGKNPGKKSSYINVVTEKGWNGKVYTDESSLKLPASWKRPRLVFVNSMSDLFHEAVPLDFIIKVFETMNKSPKHIFQVLTKRPDRVKEVANKLVWSSNIWMGTSVENKKVSSRVLDLIKVPAKIRFLSIEPLLGPLTNVSFEGIQWVIVGGESGPQSRPMKESWVLNIRDQCVSKNIPFFFKQWGGVNKKKAGRLLEGQIWGEIPQYLN